MKVVYTAEVEAKGGRQGKVRSSDGVLALELGLPGQIDATRQATNPEQLFAAGYAACFENAIIHVARRQKIALSTTKVIGRVSLLGFPEGHFNLAVELDVDLDSLDEQQAVSLIQLAHQVCPYSNATRGNVAVTLRYKGRELSNPAH